jgi:hypothetical protein
MQNFRLFASIGICKQLFIIYVLGNLYYKMTLKSEFCQAHYVEWLKHIHTKFIL